MKEFTFLTITYNHEKYICEHLESIKAIVTKYGDDIDVSLIIADDASKDKTISVIEQWISQNETVFKDVSVLKRDNNLGTVHNILDAIKHVKTDEFKLLAGDDKYCCFDIFSMYDELQEKILITPVLPFGETNIEKENQIRINYQVLINANNRNRMISLLNIDNFIPAPGLFIPGKYLRSEGLALCLEQFDLIEDYPMVMYFLKDQNIKYVVGDEAHILYRLDSGVSNTVHKKETTRYSAELNKIRRIYKMRAFILPKAINPYRYWLKIQRIKAMKMLKGI